MTFSRIAVLGLGNIGELAAGLLHETGLKVTGYDLNPQRNELSFPVKSNDLSSDDALSAAFVDVDAVLSC